VPAPRSANHLVYLALGTNLGDRPANLRRALDGLAPMVTLLTRSRVYETPPWGYTDQAPFLNQVVEAGTRLPPRSLLAYLKNLESSLGRRPTFRNGPRLIDLDILFYDDLVLDAPGITIPHPRLHERAFVLVPLAELAPGLVHPRLGDTVQEMLARVDAAGVTPLAEESPPA
jgi:2-amino-4-hydroxy-6-hydroxymethyldihydropteridine diphosphokinase